MNDFRAYAALYVATGMRPALNDCLNSDLRLTGPKRDHSRHFVHAPISKRVGYALVKRGQRVWVGNWHLWY
jgi:hypothetical protein